MYKLLLVGNVGSLIHLSHLSVRKATAVVVALMQPVMRVATVPRPWLYSYHTACCKHSVISHVSGILNVKPNFHESFDLQTKDDTCS